MKITREFVTQDWDGIIPALHAGKFDAVISSMSITEEREKVDFTNKYYNTPPAIVAPKDTDIKGVTKEGLAGKTLGVATSTVHFNYAEKTYTDSTLKGYPTSQEFLLDIANGRVDAVIDDISVLEGWLKTADGACCKLVGGGHARSGDRRPRRRHRGAQGRDRSGQQVQRRHRRHPRQRRSTRKSTTSTSTVRRLRRRCLTHLAGGGGPTAAFARYATKGVHGPYAELLDSAELGGGRLARRYRLWRLHHRSTCHPRPCRSDLSSASSSPWRNSRENLRYGSPATSTPRSSAACRNFLTLFLVYYGAQIDLQKVVRPVGPDARSKSTASFPAWWRSASSFPPMPAKSCCRLSARSRAASMRAATRSAVRR